MKKKHVRKLTITGKTGTYYVTLPKDMIRDLNRRKVQKLEVEARGDEIVIKDWTGNDKRTYRQQGVF